MSRAASESPGPIAPGLMAVLVEARARGLTGSMPLEDQVAHSLGFAASFEAMGPFGGEGTAGADPTPTRWLDLGSGGGLPGLVLAMVWPRSRAVLVDAGERRAEFLVDAVETLDVGDRVEVVRARAEDAGRLPDLRATFDLVVARSFGPPPVTAECAAPFLRAQGLLIVSEPPETSAPGASAIGQGSGDSGSTDDRATGSSRWPVAGLAPLGLEPVRAVRSRFGYQVLRQAAVCPERFPRRSGIVAKRPLYRYGGQ